MLEGDLGFGLENLSTHCSHVLTRTNHFLAQELAWFLSQREAGSP